MTVDADDVPGLHGGVLQVPRPRADAVRAHLRLALLDVRTSSRVGVALIAIPAAFVFGVVLHYGFGVEIPGLPVLESGLTWAERQTLVPGLAAVILVGAPIVAFAINALAVMHFSIDRASRELLVTLKLRATNLAIMAVSAFIVAIVFAHALSERARHGH